MKAVETIQALLNGKKVRNPYWRTECFIHIKDGMLVDERNNIWHHYFNNWEIYEETNKYFGIGEAIKRIKNGKKVSIKFWNNPKIYLMLCPLNEISGIEVIDGVWIKTIKGKLASWNPNDTELLSEEYYEVDGE